MIRLFPNNQKARNLQKNPAKGSHPGLYHCSFIQFSAFQRQQKKRCEEHILKP